MQKVSVVIDVFGECVLPTSILKGNRRMLKSDSETKAISAFNTFFSSTNTKTANVTSAT